MDKKTENTIVKFLANVADIEDLRQLELWIGNPKHEHLFLDYIKTNGLININMSQYDIEKAKKNIKKRIRQEKKTFSTIIKYAAASIVVGILASGYVFKDTIFNKELPISTPVIVNSIVPGTDKATLTLEDGTHIVLEKGASFQTGNTISNGEKIIYKNNKEEATTVIKYNYLTIPRGGQFYVKLADGTQVWLNSESQLKYPISFEAGKTRKVELIYGEAYFDVSPSSAHKGDHFKVYNKNQEINVLGTEFNIKAYKDEQNIYTTLVEGKVELNVNGATQYLLPNQQSKLNVNNNLISITKIDVYNEISWRDGVFSFKNKTLKEIMNVLSRWYDIEVMFSNKKSENEEFMGVLGKNQKIEDILTTIKNLGIITDYEIKNNRILLK
tara:strand:- start:61812 stop:62966 length:1155 start_codon:yes stop_codon:yes gene_type:complete